MKALVLGSGVSGIAAKEFLESQNIECVILKNEDIEKTHFNERFLDRLFDGLSFIVTSPGISYDKEIIDQKIAIFKHNYHEIVEGINEINNNVKVILVGSYSIYGDYDLSNNINSAIREVAYELNCHYLDIEEIKAICPCLLFIINGIIGCIVFKTPIIFVS